jgi:hypothetical protein
MIATICYLLFGLSFFWGTLYRLKGLIFITVDCSLHLGCNYFMIWIRSAALTGATSSHCLRNGQVDGIV